MEQLSKKFDELTTVKKMENDLKTTMEYSKTAAQNELHSKRKEKDIRALDIP